MLGWDNDKINGTLFFKVPLGTDRTVSDGKTSCCFTQLRTWVNTTAMNSGQVHPYKRGESQLMKKIISSITFIIRETSF